MTACHVCTARADSANLCRRCTAEIVAVLLGLRRDLDDLVAVETRMASGPLGLGERSRQWDAAPAEGSRPVTPWQYAPGAADQLWAVDNTITTWARHIAESRHVKLALGRPRMFAVNARGAAEVQPRATVEVVASWLLEHIDAVRQDEAAGQIHEELVGMAHENDRSIVGDMATAEFYGVCDKTDVRIEAVIYLGPRCTGFETCTHESCEQARNIEPLLVPRAAICGQQLYGPAAATVLRCDACGATYSAPERKRSMREGLPDSVGTIAEVAGALTQLDAPVHVDAIDSAIRRGHIPDRGKNAKGHRLVRVGDVEEYLARRAERSPRAGRIAS